MNVKKLTIILVSLFIISTPYWGYKMKDRIVYTKLKEGISTTESQYIDLKQVVYNKKGACGQYLNSNIGTHTVFFYGEFAKDSFIKKAESENQKDLLQRCLDLGLKVKASDV